MGLIEYGLRFIVTPHVDTYVGFFQLHSGVDGVLDLLPSTQYKS